MAKEKNPFETRRIEFEKNPILFMPDDMLKWVSKKPQIFEGPRGSGKSSILKSLTWEVAWNLSSIKIRGSINIEQLLKNPKYLGVYYRAEDMDAGYWNLWKIRHNVSDAQAYFGTYMDFLYIDLFLGALHTIRKNNFSLLANKEAEFNIVNHILQQAFPKNIRPSLSEYTFESLRNIITDTHLGIRELIFRNAIETEIKESYPVVGPGNLIQAFGDAFIKYYPNLANWIILVLIDDCNMLKDWQIVVLNTAVAKAKAPISYKLTCVSGLYPTRETLNDPRTIFEHDIDTIPIPGKSPDDKAYHNLINSVCRVKIEKWYGKELADKFDFKSFLGPYNLEELLAEKLKESENGYCQVFCVKFS